MSLVLDSSMAVAFLIESERTPASYALLQRVGGDGAWTPSLWRHEVANALQMAVRRGRVTVAQRDRSLQRLTALPITTDREGELRVWAETLRLSDDYGLTVYDATYLELALRRMLPLASLDQKLLAAAARAGVATL